MSTFNAFSLRNYPPHTDQMEELGLDVCAYANAMGEALAIMHWKAGIDARDVDLVLASRRQAVPAPFSACRLGEHAMWILDFDCCRPLSLDADGVDEAVVAFYRNDPIYPLPGRCSTNDSAKWRVFRDRYLETSLELVAEYDDASGVRKLPGLFIDMLFERSHGFRTSEVA